MPDIRTTGFLDDFSGPAENPLSNGGKWAQMDLNWGPMRRTGSGSASVRPGSSLDYSYWTPRTFSGNRMEVWGLATGGGGGASGNGWRLGLVTDVGMTNQYDGYVAFGFDAIGGQYTLRRYLNASFTNLASVGSGSVGAQYFLLRINGNDVEFWSAPPSDPTNWTLRCSATDTTYRTGLRLAMGAEDQSGSALNGWTTFGGGIPGSISPLPQYIRRPHRRGSGLWLP